MEREIKYLLYDVCVELGFCIPPDKSDEISKRNHLSAIGFAREVVAAEGMNPDTEKQHVRMIANVFRRRFGADEIFKDAFAGES